MLPVFHAKDATGNVALKKSLVGYLFFAVLLRNELPLTQVIDDILLAPFRSVDAGFISGFDDRGINH
jgi:hypothetical protein